MPIFKKIELKHQWENKVIYINNLTKKKYGLKSIKLGQLSEKTAKLPLFGGY